MAHYYWTKEKKDETQDIIRKMCDVIEKDAMQCPVALIRRSRFDKACKLCRQYDICDLEEKYTKYIHDIGPEILGEMVEIPFKIEYSKEELEQIYEHFTEKDLDHAFKLIAIHFMCRKDNLCKYTASLQEEFVTETIFQKEINDREGRAVAVIHSDNMNGNMVYHARRIMEINGPILNVVLKYVIEKYDVKPKDMLRYLAGSSLFVGDDEQRILGIGLQHYFHNEFCSAIHVLIPQIEEALRKVAQSVGAATIRQRQDGGYNYRILDDLLRDARLINVCGEDITWHSQLILSDHRGFNLRNNVCHGVCSYTDFTVYNTELLIHLLILLSTRFRTEQ